MATYYVDTAVGDDANAGTSEGAGNAWATIDKAMNTVAAADKVWVKASGTYSEDAVIDTAGTVNNEIEFEGYSSTTGDNGKVTMDGTTSCISSALGTSTYYTFKNFIFTGCSGDGVDLSTEDRVAWFNCEFHTNGGEGIDCDQNHVFINCEFYNNTSNGCGTGNNSIFVGCIAYGNGAQQLTSTANQVCYKCLCYGGSGSADVISLTTTVFVGMNTVDGENSATYGIDLGSDVQATVIDNIVYDCGTGINFNLKLYDYGGMAGYNLLNSNTTDYSHTGYPVGIQDVTSAPSFTDEANDDYTLSGSSPAIDAGCQPGGIT
jgi:hypothetical protein